MKQFKKIIVCSFTLFLLGFGVPFAHAQMSQIYDNPKYGTDSASRQECANNLSTMSEFMKIDLYDYALPSWRAVFENCPASSKNIYLHGVKIFRHRIENESDPERKKELLDTLMLIYDRRIEYFDQEGLVLGRKGLDKLKNDRTAIEEVYGILGRSVELSGNNAEEAVIVTFMQACIALFNAGRVEPAEVIDNYLVTTEILDAKLKSGKRIQRAEMAMDNVEALFANSGAASCEDLVRIFTPKYEADPDNIELLKKITSLLVGRDCEDTDLFANSSEKLYELEPFSDAAYNLAKLFLKREEYEKALDYYQKAIDLEEDPESKGDYCYQKSVLLLNKFERYADARRYALQAINLKPDWGEPYLVIGNAYASGNKLCGESDFEKAAVYWAAVDKFKRAKSVDPEVSDQANELINRYEQYFPNSEDAFFYGFQDGQEYTVGCWINEKTTVRTRGQ